MKKVLLIFLLTYFLSAQHFSETFSNFVPDTLANGKTEFMYHFNTSAAETDLSVNGYNLTANGFSGSYADELTSGSVILEGSNYLTFNGSTEYFTQANVANAVPAASPYTIEFIAAINWPGGANEFLFSMGTGVTDRILFYKVSSNIFKLLANDGVDAGNFSSSNVGGLSNGNWAHIAVVLNPTGTSDIYVNGVALSLTVVTAPNGSIDPTASLHLMNLQDNSDAALGNVSYFAMHLDDLTAQQVKERVHLAKGWYSKNGGVTRASWGFNQGIVSDTIYVNLADSTLPGGKQWTLTWKDSVASGTWTNRNYNFSENLSADSLFFSTTGNNLTVYTDNNTIATISQGTTTVFIDDVLLITSSLDKGYKKYKRYKGYKGR